MVLRLAGHIASMEQLRNVYKLSVGGYERRRPFRDTKTQIKDNINMDL